METARPSLERPALLVVDVQRDFCPGGALGAEGGARIIPAINRLVSDADRAGIPVYATRDWHPPVTTHFKAYGGVWPPHCVQGTPGAEFHPDLALPPDAIVINKGDDPTRHGYSAFEGHTAQGTSLLDDLRDRGVNHIYLAGIATDYCVRQSVHDARHAGLDATVLLDAVAGIDAHPGDVDRALAEMADEGAELVTGTDAFARAAGIAQNRPS
jgi:nicotinamidase/pyrazinamidase